MEKVKLKKHKKQDLFFFDKQQSQHKKERKDRENVKEMYRGTALLLMMN